MKKFIDTLLNTKAHTSPRERWLSVLFSGLTILAYIILVGFHKQLSQTTIVIMVVIYAMILLVLGKAIKQEKRKRTGEN